MKDRLKEYFYQAKYEPQKHLTQKVWHNLLLQNKRRAWHKFYAFSILGITSAIVFIPVFKMLLNNFAKSGSYEYLSLAFSSNGAIVSYWKDFILSLAESLPLSSIVLSLGLFLIFCISVRYAVKQITKGQLNIAFKL